MATRAEWIERVTKWEQSGLDAADFARREGLQPAELEWWRRALRAPQSQCAEPRGRSARVAKPCPPAPAVPPVPAWIDIVLPSGLVRVLPSVDAATLACVVAVAAELASRHARRQQTCESPPSPSARVRK
jgi:hypothetical protein